MHNQPKAGAGCHKLPSQTQLLLGDRAEMQLETPIRGALHHEHQFVEDGRDGLESAGLGIAQVPALDQAHVDLAVQEQTDVLSRARAGDEREFDPVLHHLSAQFLSESLVGGADAV